MRAALEVATARLARAGISGARADAERLLSRLLAVDRGGLLVRRDEPLAPDEERRYEEWISRRALREPLQHVIGEQEFYGLSFTVDRRALIPRPETEQLVELACRRASREASVVDLGTGSGCIAVALAHARPDLRVHALDRSTAALELARENAGRNGVEGIRFVRADLTATPPEWMASMDLVLANPPYVSESEWTLLEPEVRDFDPREALVAGPTGLEVYDVLLPVAARLLAARGTLVLELGCGQSAQVGSRAALAGFEDIEVQPDLAGIPRVLVGRKAG